MAGGTYADRFRQLMQEQPIPGAPMQLGGSSDQLMTVPSGGPRPVDDPRYAAAQRIAATVLANKLKAMGDQRQAYLSAAVQQGGMNRLGAASVREAERAQTAIAPPGIDYSGGGGGVTANDILGQRGSVVVGPPLAPAPTVPIGDPSNPLGFESMPIALLDQLARSGVGMDRPPIPAQSPIPPYNVSGAPGENRTGGTPIDYREAQLAAIPTGAMPLRADERKTPTSTTVPQMQDIRFFEENTQLPSGQLPLTPEEQASANQANAKSRDDAAKAVENASRSLEIAQGNYTADPTTENKTALESAQKAYTDALALDPTPLPYVGRALNLIDWPRQKIVEEMGNNAYDVATGKAQGWDPGWAAVAPGNWMIQGLDATRFNQDFQTWAEDPSNWQAIRNASENGFQATETDPRFTGGRAVWELFINGAGNSYKFLSDFVNDPTVVFAAGKAVGDPLIESAIRGAADEPLLANILKSSAGRLLSAPQTIMDVTVDAPFNALGRGFSEVLGNRRVAGGTLLDEPLEHQAAEQVNVNMEDLGHQERIRREGVGLDPLDDAGGPTAPQGPSGGGPTGHPVGWVETPTGWKPGPDWPDPIGGPLIPAGEPNMPRYHMESDGKQWVITDPEGKVVETHPYREPRPNASEPNYQERTAQRRVNELNKPLIRSEEESLGAVLPPSNELDWTAPNYDPITNRGRNLPQTIQSRVAYDASLDPVLRRQWMDTWTPKAKEHEAVMADFRKQETNMMQRTGVNAETDLVQKGNELLYPRKVYEMVRFYVDDALKPFMDMFPGIEQRGRRWIISPELDVTDANNLIEHAVLGTRDDAIEARKMLHRRNVSVPGFKSPREFVEHLGQMGERINGPGWRSTDPTAVKSRGIRARQAGEPAIDAAAVNEVTGTRPLTKAQLTKQRTDKINAPYYAKSESDLVMPQLVQEPTTDYNKVITRLAPDAPDDQIIREISDPATKSVTPGKNRISAKNPGEVTVRPSGVFKKNAVTIRKGAEYWEVIPQEGAQAVPLFTLQDSIEFADEILLRFKKGIDPVKEQVKRVTDDLGVVSPGTAKTINMESRVREDILRKQGAYEGPGASDAAIMSRQDRSYVGAAHQMGKIDDATYLNLSRWVNYEGRNMRLWEAYDVALAQTPDDLIGAKKRIAEAAVDADLKAAVDAGKAKVKDATGYRKAAYKSIAAYHNVLQFQREAIMFNWARGFSGAFADFVGTNYIQLINNEYGAVLKNANPLGSARHFIQDERGRKLVIDNLPGMERYKYLTGTEPPASVVQLMETRFETPGGKMMLQKLPGGKFLRAIADPDIKALRTGMDRNSRYSLHMASFDRNYKRAQNRFRGIVATRAKSTGNDYVDWLRKLDRMGNDFNPDDVLKTFGDERLARDWREMTSKARLDAKQRVDQLLFSYKMTNLDNKLRNVIFFHYWMSRALPLHTKTAFKNPWLLSAYGRAWNHMEREAEQHGYPSSVRGFIQMQGDNSGFYGLINPMQVLVPFSMLVDSNDDPGVFAFLKRWGLFINPLIEAAAASMGWTKTLPDVTATASIRRAMRYTVNWLNSNGYDGLVPDALGDPNTWQPSVVDEATYRIVETVNKYALRAANALAPSQGVIADYEGSSKNAYEYDVLNSLLINELEKKYGPFEEWPAESPAWNEYLTAKDDIAMGRDGNVLADSVVEQMADAKMENVLMSAIMPGGIYQRYGPRDTTLGEAREQFGGPADAERAMVTGGSPEGTALDTGIEQLDRLGTEDGRWGYQMYWNLAKDDMPSNQYVMLNGELVRTGDIEKMNDDQRKDFARAWISEYIDPAEFDDYTVQREAFMTKHPEVGDFKEFQKGVYGYEGGPKAWRTYYATQDGDFKDAMGKKEGDLREQGYQGDVLSSELDQWATSAEAYKVVNGFRDEVYDDPVSTKTPDYGFVEEDAAGGTATKDTTKSTPKTPVEKTKDKVQGYLDKLDLAIAGMKAAGLPNVTYEDIVFANPIYHDVYAAYGIPDMSQEANLYWQWRVMQPPGTDTSVDAWIKVLEDMGYQKAA